MLIDDFRHNGHSQSHALRFGGEERVEDIFQMLRRDSFTLIDDIDPQVFVQELGAISTVCPGWLACIAF